MGELAAQPLLVCVPCHLAPQEQSVLRPRFSFGESEFSGVTITKNFISEKEETRLIRDIDSETWVDSQSGRRKQVHLSCMVL